jgi:hypothetical protein
MEMKSQISLRWSLDIRNFTTLNCACLHNEP